MPIGNPANWQQALLSIIGLATRQPGFVLFFIFETINLELQWILG
jgi:hypothetical protein